MAEFDFRIKEKMDYETFFTYISHIPSCIFFKDKELRYQFSSHYWAQLLSEDIIGKTDLEVRKDTENVEDAMNQDRNIIATGKGCRYVIKSEIDDELAYLELIKEPVIDATGEVVGIVGLINNVTEKTLMSEKIMNMSHMLESQCTELETSNEELKNSLDKVQRMHSAQKLFTASMNHELRSPLNGIIGNLQLLLDDPNLNDEQKRSVSSAFTSSQLMLDIVNELLDFAKLEMDGMSISKERFCPAKMLDDIGFTASNQAKNKGLIFSLIKDESLPDSLVSDKKRLTQVIYNLVSNAVKYTANGSVTLKASYLDGKLIIQCTDTGQGISEESIKTLFDPYVRFNETKNANIQGTGLGLSIVKKIIENMNGEITVESEIDKGSTFTVRIPAIVADALDKKESALGKARSADFDCSGFKALCIDDSQINAKVISSLLQRIDMEADVAFNAKDGIEKADKKKYDIIFMDHLMPDIDGIKATDIIRDKSLLNSKTPVVMMTGNTGAEYKELYKSHGIEGSLEKPVLLEKIKELLSELLGADEG